MNEVVTHSSNLETEHRKGLVRTALRSISGEYEILREKAFWLLEYLSNTDSDTMEKVLQRGVRTYSDNFNKYPKNTFWIDTRRDVLREVNKAKKARTGDTKQHISEEERKQVAKQAGEMAKKFASLAKQGDEKPNLLTKKFARYREYIDKDLVRVEDRDSKLFDQWIPRAQAVQISASFHDPIIWMSERTLVEKI